MQTRAEEKNRKKIAEQSILLCNLSFFNIRNSKYNKVLGVVVQAVKNYLFKKIKNKIWKQKLVNFAVLWQSTWRYIDAKCRSFGGAHGVVSGPHSDEKWISHSQIHKSQKKKNTISANGNVVLFWTTCRSCTTLLIFFSYLFLFLFLFVCFKLNNLFPYLFIHRVLT